MATAARGALADWIVIEDGKIANYQVITPTAWNIGPRDGSENHGPMEKAFIGAPVENPDFPVELAQVYDAEGADELVFLDITATHEERDTIIHLVERTAEEVFIPFTIGGGLRSEDDIRRLEGQALLILSGQGVCFGVRDRLALDAHSRRLLDRFL